MISRAVLAWKLPYFPVSLHKITISPQARGKKGQNTPKLKRMQRRSNDLTQPNISQYRQIEEEETAFNLGKSTETLQSAAAFSVPPSSSHLRFITFSHTSDSKWVFSI